MLITRGARSTSQPVAPCSWGKPLAGNFWVIASSKEARGVSALVSEKEGDGRFEEGLYLIYPYIYIQIYIYTYTNIYIQIYISLVIGAYEPTSEGHHIVGNIGGGVLLVGMVPVKQRFRMTERFCGKLAGDRELLKWFSSLQPAP